MLSKVMYFCALIAIWASLIWYWNNAAADQKDSLFYILLGIFFASSVYEAYKRKQLEDRLLQLTKQKQELHEESKG